MKFNPAPATVMWLDINSCFATVEQQANPLLRGKPVAVAAYTTPGGCILAPSIEAKRYGVKTGMRVREGKALCPKLIILPSDPAKYRFVNRKLLALLASYSAEIEVKSIDEMVLSLANSPSLTTSRESQISEIMITIAKEIKRRIKQEIGEWLTVSVGIAPNRFLAKTAASLHKPDGLDVIDKSNIEKVLSKLKLEDLCGIKAGYGDRLRRGGITTALAFYRASSETLKSVFSSIIGYQWWLRLHGWDPSTLRQLADRSGQEQEEQSKQKTIGHSYALYQPYAPGSSKLAQILCQLVEKVGRRLRLGHYRTQGIHLSCLYIDYSCWHKGQKLPRPIYTTSDLYQAAQKILHQAPNKLVRILAVTTYNLTADLYLQESLLNEEKRKEDLTQALDAIAERFGDFVVFPGRMLNMEQKVLDRIAFGGVHGLDTA